MTEPTPDPAQNQPAEPPAHEPSQATNWDELFKGEDPTKVRKALDESRKWETRAKENRKAAEELEAQRQASMSEAEKAVAEAEKRGRTAAVTEFGQRLARTEWIAEAARRNPGYDAVSALEDLNLAKFIGEDGEPDTKAIAASVGRLVPEANAGATPPPSFDGGTRQPAQAGVSMSQLIRQAAGRA